LIARHNRRTVNRIFGAFASFRVAFCRTPNDAPDAPFLRSYRRIAQNYFRFKVS
jgi:hypothetical protein